MKLFCEYVLVDPGGKVVLHMDDGDPKHLRNMRDVYSIIYKNSLRVAARDLLGELHFIDLDGYEAA